MKNSFLVEAIKALENYAWQTNAIEKAIKKANSKL